MASIQETVNKAYESDMPYEAKEIVQLAADLANQDFYSGPAETKVQLIAAYLKGLTKVKS